MVIRYSDTEDFMRFITNWAESCTYGWVVVGPTHNYGKTLDELLDKYSNVWNKTSHIFYDGEIKLVTFDAEVYTFKRITYLGHKVVDALGHLMINEELAKLLANEPLV